MDGTVCVARACRKKCKTSVILKNGVTHMMIAGSKVRPVSKKTICRGMLVPFGPASFASEMPMNEEGSAADIIGATANTIAAASTLTCKAVFSHSLVIAGARFLGRFEF